MPLESGQSLQHYRIVEKIGEGGMGAVYRATDTKLKRDVAVKVLPGKFAQDAERLARFEREAQMLARLHHPNIASIFGIEEQDGLRALVMELVEGEDLAERLSRGAMAVDDALGIARQIALGLEAAHAIGMVHRDLKPANVKLTASGTAKILDFGLARALADEPEPDSPEHSPTITQGLTGAGTILGTAAYMSPEQAKGQDVDKRADIWAFGVVLYEMLSGRRAFGGDSVAETLASALKEEPAYERLPANLSPATRLLLKRCLRKNPGERLRDIGDARILLEDAGELESPAAAGPARDGRRKTWQVGLAALVVLVAAYLGWSLRPGPSPPETRKLDLVARDVDWEWHTAPLLSPDGDRIAYNALGGVWVRDLDDVTARLVAEVHDPVSVFWSHDGEQVAYFSQRALWRVSADGGRPVQVCPLPGNGDAIGGAWRADGTIAFASWRGGLYTVSDEGGQPRLYLDHEPGRIIDFHTPTWLPDGALLFVSHYQTSVGPTGDKAHSDQEPNAVAVFDGNEQILLDLRVEADPVWLAYDPTTGHLLYASESPSLGIFAVPFDLKARRVTGSPFLVAAGAASLSLAGNGSLLYMEAAGIIGSNELVWADRTGRVTEVIAPAKPGLAAPAISPDGRLLAVTAWGEKSTDVWVYDLDTGAESRITFSDESEERPSWYPDSRSVLYIVSTDITGALMAENADGSGERRRILDGVGIGNNEAFALVSGDGSWLLYLEDQLGKLGMRVAKLGADGLPGEGRRLIAGETDPDVLGASISPDGRLLAYTGIDTGRPEIYLTRFPEGRGLWQVSSEGGRMPRWAAESGELFFVSGSGPLVRALSVVTVQAEDKVTVGTPVALFDLHRANSITVGDVGFDVSPDGQRFAVVRSGGDDVTPARMILVQNWFEEFRERD